MVAGRLSTHAGDLPRRHIRPALGVAGRPTALQPPDSTAAADSPSSGTTSGRRSLGNCATALWIQPTLAGPSRDQAAAASCARCVDVEKQRRQRAWLDCAVLAATPVNASACKAYRKSLALLKFDVSRGTLISGCFDGLCRSSERLALGFRSVSVEVGLSVAIVVDSSIYTVA